MRIRELTNISSGLVVPFIKYLGISFLGEQPQLNQRLPLRDLAHLLALGVKRDPLLGFHIGQQWNPSSLGLLYHLVHSSNSCREGILQLAQNASLSNDLLECEFLETNESGILTARFARTATKFDHHLIDMLFTSIVTYLRQNLREHNIAPLKVQLSELNGKYLDEMRSFYLAPVFIGVTNELHFPIELLARENPNSNKELNACLSIYIKAEIEKIPKHSSELDQIRWTARELLNKNQSLNLNTLSIAMGVHSKKLQRLLVRNGFNFSTFTDEINKKIVTELLNNETLTLEMISDRLGFSEPSSFQRAFKRWYGVSPGHYRKKLSSFKIE